MPRKKKQQVRVNSNESLEGLMQETYNDACLQINDAQRTINEVSNGGQPADIDDLTKVAKAKTDALKIKDSAIKIKLEVAKLQSDILKHNGDSAAAITQRSEGEASLDDFKSIREMIKKGKQLDNEVTEE